jgi:hypothetical protein
MPGQNLSVGKKWVATAVAAVAILGLTGTSLALGASHQTKIHPDTTASYTDSTTGAIVEGVQNGTGVGVEGVGGNANGSTGILGFLTGTTTSGVGLEGLVYGPSSTGLYGQGLRNTDTAHPTVGLLGTSTSGVGVEGESLVSGGIGVEGIADDNGSSGQVGVNGGAGVFGTNSRNNMLFPGVDGESTVQGGPDAAAGFGLDYLASGNAPDFGTVSYGQILGMEGTITSNGTSCCFVGILGQEQPNVGSSAGFDTNIAILGNGGNGIGVTGISGGNGVNLDGFGEPVGAYFVGHESADSSPTNTGLDVLGETIDTGTEGMAIYDTSTSTQTQVNITRHVDIMLSDTGAPYGAGVAGDLIDGFNDSGVLAFQVTKGGNLNIKGTIGTLISPRIIPRTPSGVSVQEYGARSTVPDIEDFGEGQLANGAGYVRIDAALSNAIDHRTNYLVFITPEGDSNGLYVTDKSEAGFSVRENAGGHHSLAFSYRIVAKPVDDSGPRLAVVAPIGQHFAVPMIARARRHDLNVDAFTSYVKRVGVAQAERALAQFKADVASRALMTTRLPHADKQGNLHVGGTTIHTTPQQ